MADSKLSFQITTEAQQAQAGFDQVAAQAEAAAARVDAAFAESPVVTPTVDSAAAEAQAQALQESLVAVAETPVVVEPVVDISPAEAAIAALQVQLAELQAQSAAQGATQDVEQGLSKVQGAFRGAGAGAREYTAILNGSVSGASRAAAGGIGAMGSSLGLLGLAFGVAAIAAPKFISALHSSDEQQKETAARTKEVAAALQTEIDKMVETAQKSDTLKTSSDALALTQNALSDALTGAGDKGKALNQALGGIGAQASDAAPLLLGIKEAADAYAASTSNLTATTGDQTEAQAAAASRFQNTISSMLQAQGVAAQTADDLAAVALHTYETGEGFDKASQATNTFTKSTYDLIPSIVEIAKQAKNTDLSQIALGFLEGAVAQDKFHAGLVQQAEAQVGVTSIYDKSLDVFNAYRALLNQTADGADGLTRSTDQVTSRTEGLVAAYANAAPTLDQYNDAVRDGTDLLLGGTTVTEDNTDATQKATQALQAQLKVLSPLEQKLSDSADAADTFRTALDKLFGNAQSSTDAEAAYQKSIDDLTKSMKENGKTTDIGTEKGRNNRQAIEDQVDAIKGKIESDYAETGSTDKTTVAAEKRYDALVKQVMQMGLTKDAAQKLIAQYGLTPDNITTAVNLAGTDVAKQKIADQITALSGPNGIPKSVLTEIQTDVDNGDLIAAQKALDAYKATLASVDGTTIHTYVVQTLDQATQEGTTALGGDAGAAPTPPGKKKKGSNSSDAIQAGGLSATPGAISSSAIAAPLGDITHTVAQAASAVGDATDAAIKEQDRLQAALYHTGRESLADYQAYVQGRLAASQDLSDDYLSQYDLLQSLNDKKAQSDDAALKATTDAQAQAAKDSAAAIEKIYTDAQNARDQALDDAQEASDRGSVAAAGAAAKATRGKTKAQQAQDKQAYVDAQKKLADDAYTNALAKAAVAGLEVGTVDWDRFMRAALSGTLAGYVGLPITQQTLASYLTGIPALAAGGIVPATPGGRLVRAGEGGHDEAIVPLDGRHGIGGHTFINHFHGSNATAADARREQEWTLAKMRIGVL